MNNAILLEHDCSPYGDTICLESNGDEYIVLYNNEVMAECKGRYGLIAAEQFYHYYYKKAKHFLYPNKLCNKEEFKAAIENNYKIYDEIEEKNSHIDKVQEDLKDELQCIELGMRFRDRMEEL
ncbi:MAG: hypothetical protein ACRDB0_06135 [Paraclostridium sp.]